MALRRHLSWADLGTCPLLRSTSDRTSVGARAGYMQRGRFHVLPGLGLLVFPFPDVVQHIVGAHSVFADKTPRITAW